MKMRALWTLALVALLFGWAPGCNGSGGTEGGGTASLTAFVATDIDGEEVDMADHIGKHVILMSFWATWCEPCKNEMPVLQKLHENYREQGLAILSISMDGPDTRAGVKPYIRSHKYTFPVIIDEDSAIAAAYNPRTAAPYSVLIDRKGQVAKKMEGFQISEADLLEAEVKALLAR